MKELKNTKPAKLHLSPSGELTIEVVDLEAENTTLKATIKEQGELIASLADNLEKYHACGLYAIHGSGDAGQEVMIKIHELLTLAKQAGGK